MGIIIFELTNQLSLSVPVLLAVIVARPVAMLWSKSIFHKLAEVKGLPVMPSIWRENSYVNGNLFNIYHKLHKKKLIVFLFLVTRR